MEGEIRCSIRYFSLSKRLAPPSKIEDRAVQ